MIYDIEDSPVFKMVTINGRLTFKPDAVNLHLKAKHIYVRAGELHIGNETHPHKGEAKITLYGEKNFSNIAYTNAIEAGNKLIANVGKIFIYGAPR